jgi:hypothetical protein
MRHTKVTQPGFRQQIDPRIPKYSLVPLKSQSLTNGLNGITDWHEPSTFVLVRDDSKREPLGGFTVNIARRSKLSAFLCAIATILITSSAFAATGKTRQLTPGEKAKMSGLILSRDGDLVRLRDKKRMRWSR